MKTRAQNLDGVSDGVGATRAASAPGKQASRGKQGWIAPALLLLCFAALGGGLAVWKVGAIQKSNSAAAHQPEQMESVTVAVATEQEYRPTSTSIGTVVALRSITLRNEIAGTVQEVSLTPGRVVEEGALLVALDVSVEKAELKAQEAQAALAKTLLGRMERALQSKSTSPMEVDRARAQLDVAQAQIARIEAVIARKTIRAPFRARMGISDVHPGQYLTEGSLLTTLQGVDDSAYVDFAVPQHVAEHLKQGDVAEVFLGADQPPVSAEVLALDSRVSPSTRSTMVRARVTEMSRVPSPGAAVRVRVPASAPITAVAVPVSALRRSPSGDHVFIIKQDQQGHARAEMRPTRAGLVTGDQVLLLSGVAAGDRVASQGSFKLRDNVLVAIAQTSNAAVR